MGYRVTFKKTILTGTLAGLTLDDQVCTFPTEEGARTYAAAIDGKHGWCCGAEHRTHDARVEAVAR